MKLYHSTSRKNWESIKEEGLKPNGLGIIYLSPTLKKAVLWNGQVTLEVETGDLKLTAFDDCKEWEVLCWTQSPIPPERLKEVESDIELKLKQQ